MTKDKPEHEIQVHINNKWTTIPNSQAGLDEHAGLLHRIRTKNAPSLWGPWHRPRPYEHKYNALLQELRAAEEAEEAERIAQQTCTCHTLGTCPKHTCVNTNVWQTHHHKDNQ